MATLPTEVEAAMQGTALSDVGDTRKFYYLTSPDILSLKSAIETKFADEGYTAGQIVTLTYSQEFQSAFNSWLDVANITGTEISTTLPSNGVLVVAVSGGFIDNQGKSLAGVVLPLGSRQLLVINTTSAGSGYFALGGGGYATLLHEIGHAFGLKHSFSEDGKPTAVPAGTDSEKWTVMSYTEAVSRPITPQLYDVGVIQNMYATSTARSGPNSIYEFRIDQGALLTNETNKQIFRTGGVNHWGRVTIWDGGVAGDGDTIDASTFTENVKINLNQAAFSNIGGGDNVSIGYGVDIENAKGGDGSDVLIGNSLANTLTGNTGNDTLDGGLAANAGLGGVPVGRSDDAIDTLIGGEGSDTFLVRTNTNGTRDIVQDQGASDTVIYYDKDGMELPVLPAFITDPNNANVANSIDQRWRIVLASGTLTVTDVGTGVGLVDLTDWQDGDYGIRKIDPRPNPVTTLTITGDLQPQDFDPVTPGIQTQLDALGNVIVTGTPEPDRNDTLNDSSANDRLIAGGGNDTVRGIRGGADWMSGDAGRDDLAGGAGADLIEGGADGVFSGEVGGDIAYGDAGNDELYATLKLNVLDAINQGASGTATGVKGEFLSGGADDDWAIGGAANDYLDGGSGKDVLVGGLGDDDITGDLGRTATTPLWVINRNVSTVNGATTYTMDFASGIVTSDTGQAGADVIYAGAGDDWVLAGGGGDYVDAGSGNDIVFGEAGSDVLIGGAGNDLLAGDNSGVVTGSDEGGDYLEGGVGNDTLQGNGGNDVLIGGIGDDVLSGGAGKDTYVFNLGDGVETIFDTDASSNSADASVLILGSGINRADIKFRVGSLMVDVGGGNQIHFNGFNQFDPTASTTVGEIRFDDGTAASYADILAQGFDIDGTEGNDNNDIVGDPRNLLGTGVADRIRGFGGNDLLFGVGSNDVLDGGTGADSLVGGAGADTFYGGDGADRIWGGGDNGGIVAPDGADVAYGGAGNDFIQGDDGGDQLYGEEDNDTIYGMAGADLLEGHDGDDALYGEGYYFVDDVPFLNLFDDGAVDTLRGGNGADLLNGAGGDDVLDGGAGNDALHGETGNDKYIFGYGYGQDTVFDLDTTAGNIDLVELAVGISPDGVVATRGTAFVNDLVLTIDGTTDSLTLANYYTSAADRVEEIRFADGTVWTISSISLLIQGTTGSNNLVGTSGSDIFSSLAGNDTMSGGTGNDSYRIYRGDGQDVVTDTDSTAGNVDKIVYAADILPSQVLATRSGDNLVLSLTGTTDRVTVTSYFVNDGITPYSVEQVKFLADGTIWDLNTIKPMVLVPTDGSDQITGYASDDNLLGLGGHDTLRGAGGNDTLDGGAGFDQLFGDSGDDALIGGADNDILRGDVGNDVLSAGSGNDNIFAGTGNDTLDGGTGNDTLQGEAGNDTYLITRDDGQDDVTDVDAAAGNVDTLTFAADVLPSEVQVSRSSNHLLLTVAGTATQIRVTDYFQNDATGPSVVEQITFAVDNTIWDVNTVRQLALVGTSGSDNLQGYATADFLSGLGGNDSLYGGAGNDTFDGGAGSDYMEGGTGDDEFLFYKGGGIDSVWDTVGNDKIVFAADILPPQVNVSHTSYNYITLSVAGTADSVTFYHDDFQNPPWTIEQFQFLANGTVWDIAAVKAMAITPTTGSDSIYGFGSADSLVGLSGDDSMYGGLGDDTLEGGPGADRLHGAEHSDTYLFGPGDGADEIYNHLQGISPHLDSSGSTDVLQFKAGILPSQIVLSVVGNDLRLAVSGTSDTVMIKNYLQSGLFAVEQIRFADGTVWTESTVLGMLVGPTINGTAGPDTLSGTVLAESINGLAGNDTIFGGSGNDTLDGGSGSDWIYGGEGNDNLISGAGDANNASVTNRLFGGNGNDVLVASTKSYELKGESGNDILIGGGSGGFLEEIAGNNLMYGAAGVNRLDLGDNTQLVIGGAGDDSIDGDNVNINGIFGKAILSYNKTDGADSVRRIAAGSTISIGGGTLYSNLSFAFNSTALLLKTGNSHSIFLHEWYGSPAQKNISTLQIVIEGTSNYNANSTNPLNNRKIQTFNFQSLVAAWDAAGRPSNWSVANNLAAHRVGGSDTEMIGGAIAYQYARNSNLNALSYSQMQAVLNDPNFGIAAQSITAVTALAATEAATSESSALFAAESLRVESVSNDNGSTTENVEAIELQPQAHALPEQAADATVEHSVIATSLIPENLALPKVAVERAAAPVPGAVVQVPGLIASPTPVIAAEAAEPVVAGGARFAHAAAGESPGASNAGSKRGASAGDGNVDAPGPAKASVNDTQRGDKPEVSAEKANKSTPDESDALVTQWFNRSTQNDDLTLLDDILRGDTEVSTTSPSDIAAEWERTHQWLSRYANLRNGAGDADADGADLSGLSYLGLDDGGFDMPRAVVGLRGVAGHELKAFKGLQEGVKVLGTG